MLIALSLSLAACGGTEDDSPSSSSSGSSNDYNALSGTWYSASLGASWSFSPDPSRVSTGQLRQRSSDGGSCQITYIEYTVNSTNKTITYYGTRYAMTGNSDYNYDRTELRGPYTTTFASTAAASHGNGTYSQASSRAC